MKMELDWKGFFLPTEGLELSKGDIVASDKRQGNFEWGIQW